MRDGKKDQDYDCPYPLRLGDKIVLGALAVFFLIKIIQWIT